MIVYRKYIYYCVALLSLAFIMTSCAGASAPPLELPAPVTGQIDVSAPDAEGKATITGNEGAVTGGATVLAINESEVETSLWQITDFLFPKAYAQTFPGVCDLEGRACSEAEPDGTFSLQIGAVVGDQIILVLISSDGEEISDRVTVSVPAGSGIQACGSGFDGDMVAIENVDGVVYSLFAGSEEKANVLKIGDLEFEIPGCFAKDLSVIEDSAGLKIISAASSSDNTLWIGKWNGENLAMGLTYSLDIEPQKTTFAGDSAEVLVAGVNNSVQVKLIAIEDGSTIHSLTTNNTEEDEVTALNAIGPFADGGYLGIVVAHDVAGYYLTFFLANTFTNVTSNLGEIFLSANAMGTGGDNPVVADAVLGSDLGQIRFAITDRQTIDPGFRSIRVGIGVNPIFLTDNASSFHDLLIDNAYAVYAAPQTFTYPRRFVTLPFVSTTDAYVVTDEDYLWRLENCFKAGAIVQAFFPLTSELPDPLFIATDESGTSLTGGNAAGTTADLSIYLAP